MSKPATDGDVAFAAVVILVLVVIYSNMIRIDHDRIEARLKAICETIPECVSEEP